jgi:hypothetical protein
MIAVIGILLPPIGRDASMPRGILDVDDMRAFQTVAKLLSSSGAGLVLSVRKSAISRSIQRLEALAEAVAMPT